MSTAKKSSESSSEKIMITPYPIDLELLRPSAEKRKGKIKTLNVVGLLMESPYEFYKLGEVFEGFFQIPTTSYVIKEKLRVIKTQQPVEHFRKGEMPTHMIVELHFTSLQDHNLKTIQEFLSKIGQKT